jgi:hypothetical protein
MERLENKKDRIDLSHTSYPPGFDRKAGRPSLRFEPFCLVAMPIHEEPTDNVTADADIIGTGCTTSFIEAGEGLPGRESL